MSQFDSELDANDSGKKFDALSGPPFGPTVVKNFVATLFSVLLNPKSAFDVPAAIGEIASALQEDRRATDAREAGFLLETVVSTVKRHERFFDAIHGRLGNIETRLDEGLRVALRYPNDGSQATLERLALVIVRGAIDFEGNAQEQTSEFLRVASQITESETLVLDQIYEFQEGLSRQEGHVVNQSNWLGNVAHAWGAMIRKYTATPIQWMHRKSALVRLQSYGFIERIPGNPTGEGSELGQAPYALLPLGRDFYEYSRSL
jgi:hypothetical protein